MAALPLIALINAVKRFLMRNSIGLALPFDEFVH